MGKEQLLAEIIKLPPQERSDLIDAAIESLPEEFASDPDLTPELRAELDRRYAELLRNPNSGSTWEEVSAFLKSRATRGNS